MHISEFNFELPDELIAQQPMEPRDASRMLVVDRKTQTFRDGAFTEFPSLFESGDVIALNNTRVFPARLLGHRVVNGERGAFFPNSGLHRRALPPVPIPATAI